MKNFLVFLVTLALTACATTSGTSWTDIVGRQWNVVGDLAPATITFDANDRATGKVLNSYFASYERGAAALTFGPVGSTQMAGPEKDMKREREFHELLGKVFRWNVAEGRLQLLGQDGQVLLTFESS